jgi:hypothetical protein
MNEFSGTKYHRMLLGIDGVTAITDVYRVLTAFNVKSPSIQHALKKLLCAGIRGKGDELQDFNEAIDAIKARIIEINQINGKIKDEVV